MSDLSNGREDAINRLVESNLGFVVTVAREYRHLGLPFEDLLNEGNLGLIEAARRYDPEKGARFITYAIWWIRKLILRALTQRSTLVRIPDSKAKKLKDIRRAQANLRQSLGRDPSRREVSEHLEMRQENLDRLIQLTPSTASIDAPVDERHDVPLGEFLRHIGVSTEQEMIRRQGLERMSKAFTQLTDQQRNVLTLRFGLGGDTPRTLSEVGRCISLSRERVRQIQDQATRRLRKLVSSKRLVNSPARPPRPSRSSIQKS
jgi:RNA polymerase primary sigma factor